MSALKFGGIEVHFPFEPYDVQEAYMKKVIECLQRKVNGILESPTGTGKTLCLLCATLGWQQKQKELIEAQKEKLRQAAQTKTNQDDCEASWDLKSKLSEIPEPPQIIYASRTHTQLKQAVHELKQTSYGKKVNCVVIGSREQLCIHPKVMQERDSEEKADICKRLRKRIQTNTDNDKGCGDCGNRNSENFDSKCQYYQPVDRISSILDEKNVEKSGLIDIEDLVQMGQKLNICPYYTARALQKDADIIFMPYNYVLMPQIRNTMKNIFLNSIVILDEAHNINKVCEDAASLTLRTSDITKSIEEVAFATTLILENTTGNFGSFEAKTVSEYSQEKLEELKTTLLALEKVINEMVIKNYNGDSYSGKEILRLFKKAGITCDNGYQLQTMCMHLSQFLAISEKVKKRQGSNLKKMSYVLQTIFTNESDDDDKESSSCYKVFVELTSKSPMKQNNELRGYNTSPEKTINYWCFSPAVNMKRLANLGIHSILLTSGTLGPIPALVSELGIDFPVTLENGHVIKPEQVYIAVVSNGPDKQTLNSNFYNRSKTEYQQSLGWTVQQFSEIIPHGLLVFFPSYVVLDISKKEWLQRSDEIWNGISKNKAIFMECQERREFKYNMDGYERHMKDENEERGACFLAVCRGKVSEGLDFSDNNGRGVIITGLPFLPSKDAKVMLKREYLDRERSKKPGMGLLSGSEWYELEASRAVNQAIGRVIRHRNDYGAILLCDERFKSMSFKRQISAWLRPFIKIADLKTIQTGVGDFLKKAKKLFPMNESLSGSWAEPTSDETSDDDGCATPSVKTSKAHSSTDIADTPTKRSKLEATISKKIVTPEQKDGASSNGEDKKLLAARRKLQMSTKNEMECSFLQEEDSSQESTGKSDDNDTDEMECSFLQENSSQEFTGKSDDNDTE